MVRQIHLKELRSCPDKKYLGHYPKPGDVSEIIHEDVDVYLPSGELCIAYRVGAVKHAIAESRGGLLTPENLKYWQWVSKDLSTDQRGDAAGKEIVTNPEIRVTLGQWEFFKEATKGSGVATLEQARAIAASNTCPSRQTFYVNKVLASGLVDTEELERLETILNRKTKYTYEEQVEARRLRDIGRLAWFDNWLVQVWDKAEDKVAAAKEAKAFYVTGQPRSNRCLSNVLGTMDRSGRIPYGRLSASTTKKYEEFEANKPFYHEINDLLREHLPDKFKVLNDRFSHVADYRYNLFGTAFTTITINNNFQVAYHRDGNNAQGAVAVLTVMEIGEWSGGQFLLPETGLGFELREGDVFIGDNQGLIHGMLPIEQHSADAENIMFVFYQRDRVVMLDDLECETCRKEFLEHCAKNLKHKGTGEPKWAGSWEGMWKSEEWKEFKLNKAMERCSETNYWCT
jgi:hypothetical protein